MAVQAYKALVNVRWRNRESRAFFNVCAGDLVTFDAGDFNEPGGDVTAALTSLEDVLARGLFEPFDPKHAGDPEHMSRDELLNIVATYSLGDFQHDTPAEVLRPVVAEYLAGVASATKGAKSESRKVEA